MILTGHEIKSAVRDGRISITPFNEAAVSPDSYDLTLGSEIIRYTGTELDTKQPNAHEKIIIPPEGLKLESGSFVLGHSAEEVASDHFAALIHARSSIARLGLFVHVTSDLVHVGSSGHITFQLYATMPVTLYPNMDIAQITFWVPKGEIMLYRGKYHGAKGVRASEIHKDFGK